MLRYHFVFPGSAQNFTYKMLTVKEILKWCVWTWLTKKCCYAIFNFFYRNKIKILFLLKKKIITAVLTNLDILRCLENDLTIFRKCLSVCVIQIFCGKYNSKTYAPNFIRLYIQLHHDLNWCFSTFGGNQFTDGTVFALFPKFFLNFRSQLLNITILNIMYEILSIRNSIDSIYVYIAF